LILYTLSGDYTGCGHAVPNNSYGVANNTVYDAGGFPILRYTVQHSLDVSGFHLTICRAHRPAIPKPPARLPATR
jgi:hypothetical protein